MIEIRDLAFSYGKKAVFSGLTLDIPAGVVCLSGGSGRGKTTLLRLLAGLEKPDAGSITGVPPHPALLFQDDRLLPWLTAEENVAAVLPENEKARAGELLAAMELSELAESYPGQMSGGQCRRVSLARALAFESGLMLLDEPFTGLDAALSGRMARLLRERGGNILVVTHSQADIEALGGTVIEL